MTPHTAGRAESPKLHAQNHDLYRRVQHLVSLRWHWEAIAIDVGVYNVKELCDWVLAYREPKKLPMVRAGARRAMIRTSLPTMSPKHSSEQFIVWRRENAGARKALEAIGQ